MRNLFCFYNTKIRHLFPQAKNTMLNNCQRFVEFLESIKNRSNAKRNNKKSTPPEVPFQNKTMLVL